MKSSYITKYIILFLYSASLTAFCQETGRSIETIYNDWHAEIKTPKNRLLQLSRLVGTNNVSPKLIEIVGEINQRRLEMAYFLCEKVATEKEIGDKDARLLTETAGIYWFAIEGEARHTQDFVRLLSRLSMQFSQDWKDGGFAPIPVKTRVGALCKALAAKQSDYVINPEDLLAIRRFGIFAIPELIEQIKLNNSNYAFAAFLIINRDSKGYADYIEDCQQRFVSKEEKLVEVKAKIEQFKQGAALDSELVKLMVAATQD